MLKSLGRVGSGLDRLRSSGETETAQKGDPRSGAVKWVGCPAVPQPLASTGTVSPEVAHGLADTDLCQTQAPAQGRPPTHATHPTLTGLRGLWENLAVGCGCGADGSHALYKELTKQNSADRKDKQPGFYCIL